MLGDHNLETLTFMVVETLQHLQIKMKPSTTLSTGLLVSGTTWCYALQ